MAPIPEFLKDKKVEELDHEVSDIEIFLDHYDFDHDDFIAAFGAEDLKDFLEHAGVKGMKWGVRKRDRGPRSVTVTNSSNGRSAEIKINPKKTTVNLADGTISTSSRKELKSINMQMRKNKLKLMSDDELKDRIKRLEMEQKYKKLTAEQRNTGRQLVGKILAEAGKTTVTNIVMQQVQPRFEAKLVSVGSNLIKAARAR